MSINDKSGSGSVPPFTGVAGGGDALDHVEPGKLSPAQREALERRRHLDALQTQRMQGESSHAFAMLLMLLLGAKPEAEKAKKDNKPTGETEVALTLDTLFLDEFSDGLGIDSEELKRTVGRVQRGEVSALDAARHAHAQINPDTMDLARAEQAARKYAAKGHPLLELIASRESGGNYNIAWGGKVHNLTSMTVNEVIAWQEDQIRKGVKSTACGKYQFICATLKSLRDEYAARGENIGNKKFDENMQERLGMTLLERRGLNEYLAGRIDDKTFMTRVSMEWAAMPKDMGGKSFYAGDGLNKAHVNPALMLATMRLAKAEVSQGQSGMQLAFNGGGVAQKPSSVGNPSVSFNAGGKDQAALAAAQTALAIGKAQASSAAVTLPVLGDKKPVV